MFSAEYLDKLDPTYRNLLEDLVQKTAYENANYDEENNEKLIKSFSKKYMLPLEFWYSLYEEYSSDDNPEFAYYQFYLTEDTAIELEFEYSHKLLSLMSVFEDDRMQPRLIEFPNYLMDQILLECEETADKPLPKKSLQKFAKARPIYEKIVSNYSDSEVWFNALTEAEDVEFVKHNVECRLGGDLTDKALWKLYIHYLENHDVEAMLHTLSKYCRFYLDDVEMKEKYNTALEKYGKKFEVPWKNVFSLEICTRKAAKKCVQKLKQKGRNLESENESEGNVEKSRKRKKPPHFRSNNAVHQKFAFKETLIYYILKNCDYFVGQKLLKSCKYFYANYPHPFCYKLEMEHSSSKNAEEITEESIKIKFKNSPENIKLKNLRISTIFNFVTSDSALTYDNNLLSEIILTIISQCTAKYVCLKSEQILTFNELKLLIGAGNIIKLEIDGIQFFDSERKPVVIEEILKLTPKIMHFNIKNPAFSQQSAQVIAELPFENLICYFSFLSDKNEFEPYAFAKFVTKNFSHRSEIRYYESAASLDGGPNFDEILQNAVNEKWKGMRPPYINKISLSPYQ
uniref:Uncharacterized protein n=1 Tax=Panagrolaimus sp. ES5 TaxID=591445 RepID=A0AC34FTX8_9BILA